VTGISKEGPDAASTPVNAEDEQGDDEAAVAPRTWVLRLRSWRESIRRRPTAYGAYRFGVAIVGGGICVGGLALIPLPGPGWLIVFIGLAILATEFEWAARLEKFARDKVSSWTHWLGEQSIFIRALIGLLTVVLVVCVIYAIFVVTGVPGLVPDSWVPDLPGL
jgi:uncharacterized protein (TIGR02611 family)